MKGIYNAKPPSPKYHNTWDVNIILNFISNMMANNSDLSLKELSLKLAMLIALTSGQRAQSIHEMDLELCQKHTEKFTFIFNVILKTSKPDNNKQLIEVIKFSDPALCPYRCLETYIERTNMLRQNSKLWISWKKPHKHIQRQTISRWLKCLLHLADIDTDTFSGHSTRHASTSKAQHQGVGLDCILKTACWSSDTNFKKFYLRSIPNHNKQHSRTFAEAIR